MICLTLTWPWCVHRLVVGQSITLRKVVTVLGVPDALVPFDQPVNQISLAPGYWLLLFFQGIRFDVGSVFCYFVRLRSSFVVFFFLIAEKQLQFGFP